jgi:hypothetical protein
MGRTHLAVPVVLILLTVGTSAVVASALIAHFEMDIIKVCFKNNLTIRQHTRKTLIDKVS